MIRAAPAAAEPTDYGTEVDLRRKAIEKARADLALHGGHMLHELADGSFLVSRWNLTRPCADLQAVRAFVAQLGARA